MEPSNTRSIKPLSVMGALALTAAALLPQAATAQVATPAQADGAAPPSTAFSQELHAVSTKLANTVVAIHPRGKRALSSGRAPAACGVVIDPRGYILTATTVLPSARDLEVISRDGSRQRARVIIEDANSRLAIVKTLRTVSWPAATLASTSKITRGSLVLTMGNPYHTLVRDGQVALSMGRVSTIAPLPGDNPTNTLGIETDAAVNPGSFGGPMVNTKGHVVGVVVPAVREDRWLGVAVPAVQAQALLAQAVVQIAQEGQEAEKAKKVAAEEAASTAKPRGVLGFYLFDGDDSGPGALVPKVRPDSPAAKAGLRPGDRITTVNGEAVASAKALGATLRKVKAGEVLKLTADRDGWQRAFSLTAVPAPGSVRPYLGLRLSETETGLKVDAVPEGGPGAAAGLKVGDVLQGFVPTTRRTGERRGRQRTREAAKRPLVPLGSLERMRGLVQRTKPGGKLHFEVERDGWRRVFVVTLGTRVVSEAELDAEEARRKQAETPKHAEEAQPRRTERRRRSTRTQPRTEKRTEAPALERGFLGVYPVDHPTGVLIRGVVADSPADRAGVKDGDLVINVGGKPVKGIEAFSQAMAGSKVGDKIKLTVLRDGNSKDLEVTLGQRQSIEPKAQPQGEEPEAEGTRKRATREFRRLDRATAKPYLGVKLEKGDDGLRVIEVVDASPAAQAGLKVGETITTVNQNPVRTVDDFRKALEGRKVGDTLTVSVRWSMGVRTATITLGTQK